MENGALQRYLHQHIPLSAAMDVSVVQCTDAAVVLEAPLPPNINHRDTAFGGSVSALAILAAWALVHTRLETAGVPSTLVIQRNSVEYTRPILDDFRATAALKDPRDWEQFLKVLLRKGRSRIVVASILTYQQTTAASFEGEFVAFRREVVSDA